MHILDWHILSGMHCHHCDSIVMFFFNVAMSGLYLWWSLLLWQSNNGRISLAHVIFQLLLSQCCCFIFLCWIGFYWWMIWVLVLWCLASDLRHISCHLLPVAVLLPFVPQILPFLSIALLFHHKILCKHILWWLPWLCQTGFHSLHLKSSLSLLRLVCVKVHTLLLLLVRTSWGSHWCLRKPAVLSLTWEVACLLWLVTCKSLALHLPGNNIPKNTIHTWNGIYSY